MNNSNAASNQQLEPCPFCGSPAHIRKSVVDARRTEKQFEYFVACPLFPRAMNPRSTEIEAVTDWNYRSRVSDGGVVATVDQMWEALKVACCKNPAEAKLAVFVSEKKFKDALAPFTATASPATPKEEAGTLVKQWISTLQDDSRVTDEDAEDLVFRIIAHAATPSPDAAREAAKEWFVLRGEKYPDLQPAVDELAAIIHSHCFPSGGESRKEIE